ncbi:two pore calcium channel protein 2-like isoform X1 [Acropora millepora]|uniref:two pore calcium channel protein 2-like isoform X1 n=2 Tax=Acropora millepora TaxID=45264 RepID=UPI001CF43854|nr:two pore calcium channel protein 2-like isoform X1 [Acropora millepora]
METMEVATPILGKEDLPDDLHEDGIGHTINQAAVFLEDAVKYRSIHHKVDSKSLWMYRWYYSKPFRWGFSLVIFLNLMLAFVEKPSSFTSTSDPRFRGKRPDPPCGVTECVEIFFLLCFVCDLFMKSQFLGRKTFLKSRWLLTYCILLTICFCDVLVSISAGCKERIKIRRVLRPFFLLQNSSLMKKLLHAIKRTVPEILSVLFLLLLHLWFFAMCGMLMFPQKAATRSNKTRADIECSPEQMRAEIGVECEGNYYFPKLEVSLRSLLVLLTTANNPDVMMYAYMKNRLYAVFFIIFTMIGLYFFLNLLTAIIYNQFRGYLTSSLQASFFRRRVGIRAAFEVLLQIQDPDSDLPHDTISSEHARRAIEKAQIGSTRRQLVRNALSRNSTGHLTAREFQDLFDVLVKVTRRRQRPAMSYVQNFVLRNIQVLVAQKVFDYVSDFVVAVNVVVISVLLEYEQDTLWENPKSIIGIANFFFVLYYALEQLIKLWALGCQRYRSSMVNIYAGVVTLALVLAEISYVSLYGFPFSNYSQEKLSENSLRNLTQIINILITFRLLRIVPNVRALSLILETLLKLLKNLRPFAGIIVAVYYVFAVLGMMLFANVTDPSDVGKQETRLLNKKCGTFGQLQYYANNFDDFFAALVVLWDLMVVNNWHVFLKEYSTVFKWWAQLYFVAWYLISVILVINLFVALILEAFVSQWETKQRRQRQSSVTQTDATTIEGDRFHQLFSSSLVEPLEEDIMQELRGHVHCEFQVSDQSSSEHIRPRRRTAVNFRL